MRPAPKCWRRPHQTTGALRERRRILRVDGFSLDETDDAGRDPGSRVIDHPASGNDFTKTLHRIPPEPRDSGGVGS
jgi:hypothetical protein